MEIPFSKNPKARKTQKFLFWMLFAIAMMIAFFAIFGMLVQFLWNALLVDLFSAPAISFWQAIGLLVLAKLFFGFGMGRKSGARFRSRHRARNRKLEDDVFSSEAFRDYWQKEGKQAFDDFTNSDTNP